jgi:hypothetical protein
MAAMKRGLIGVWFSAALAILILGAWVGYKTGSKVALYWVRHQREKQGSLHGPDREHAESALSALDFIQTAQVYTGVAQNDKDLSKKYLLGEIEGLEKLQRLSDAQEIRPVTDLYLGLAYVDAALVDEQQNNRESAATHMSSAQTLFQSLGWRDYSAGALKTVAGRELDKWKLHTPTEQKSK